ncbi:MAG TPA: molybdopterin converting factor subunit 1 [Chloroflexota bacterium]|nr:molybdopterin converting factor subunit 1 [Chloroflexota bacterium]
MHVQARFFAAHRERIGKSSLAVELPDGATVASLVEEVAARYPELRPLLGASRFAVNREYAALTTGLQHGDEVAFVPPVAGGSGS